MDCSYLGAEEVLLLPDGTEIDPSQAENHPNAKRQLRLKFSHTSNNNQ